MITCKAKLNEAVLIEGCPTTVVFVGSDWVRTENCFGVTATLDNTFVLLNGAKNHIVISRNYPECEIPF